MRIVFDANVFVSFFLNPGEAIQKLFNLWQEKKFEVLVSPEIKTEILKVVQYPRLKKYFESGDIEVLKYLLDNETELVFPKKRVFVCKDPFDNMYLECCFEGKARFLITGDKKHLLPLKKFTKTKIVSPKEFIEIFEG